MYVLYVCMLCMYVCVYVWFVCVYVMTVCVYICMLGMYDCVNCVWNVCAHGMLCECTLSMYVTCVCMLSYVGNYVMMCVRYAVNRCYVLFIYVC